VADPSKSTLKALGAVSGNRCAFPSCFAPIYDTEHGKLVGQVAHIKAENVLGPRYDENQTDAERHGFNNLVFMCPSHHLVIDDVANLSEYTVEALLNMKRDHEARARNTIVTEDVLGGLVQRVIETIAARMPAWSWTKFKDDIVDKVRDTEEAKAVLKKEGRDVGYDWEKLEWESAANKYREKIQLLYGTTRILGKPEPISLEGIFTDVFILDKPTAYQRYDITKLRNDSTHNSTKTANRIDGLTLVQSRPRLFILGKPGAGKTTFLKYVALQTVNGKFGKVPIFIGLKEWADSGLDLMSFIEKQFAICGFPKASPFVEYILDQGKAVVMFDGLDEVRQEDDKRAVTISNIRDFTNKYFGCKCLITCRIAATDYTFEQFEYVEIADFTDEQIFTYARKWFDSDEEKYEAFAKVIKRPENRGLYEIASVPILLTLLCLSFNASLEFPHRRVEVYEEALDALLKTWDATRNIRRDEIYRNLTHTRKRQMLARLAAVTFQENKYFVPQAELANHIVAFLRTLPGTEVTTEIDGDSVLKAIEAHHGILSERARLIYSFSHLTFQEYFAAKAVVDDPSGRSLRGLLSADTVASDRWREVILMAASLMDSGDVFFERFQDTIAQFASGFPNLLKLFDWADRKARKAKNPDIVAGRLYYLSLGLIFDNDRSMSRNRARACQAALAESEKFLGPSQSSNLFRNQLTAFPLGLNEGRANNEALNELDRAYDLSAELEIDGLAKNENLPQIDLELSRLSFISSLFARSLSEGPRRVLGGKFAAYFRKLRDRCYLNIPPRLEEVLSEIDPRDKRLVAQHKWLTFDQNLRTFLQESNDIGYEWGLGERHVETLTNIIRASGLMSECLNVAAIADRTSISSHLLSLSPSSEFDGGILVST
jgi:Predicted NTPase (NACHT family)